MPTLHEQIQALLNEEKTQEALSLFAKIGKLEAQLMQGRYDRLMQDQAEGRGNLEHWNIEHKRIQFGLLELAKGD